jgi:hypothetical protein
MMHPVHARANTEPKQCGYLGYPTSIHCTHSCRQAGSLQINREKPYVEFLTGAMGDVMLQMKITPVQKARG